MGRITRAAAELAAADRALEETTKQRGENDPAVRVEDALFALEIGRLYAEREFADVALDDEDNGFIPDAPLVPAPDPGAGLEDLLEDAP